MQLQVREWLNYVRFLIENEITYNKNIIDMLGWKQYNITQKEIATRNYDYMQFLNPLNRKLEGIEFLKTHTVQYTNRVADGVDIDTMVLRNKGNQIEYVLTVHRIGGTATVYTLMNVMQGLTYSSVLRDNVFSMFYLYVNKQLKSGGELNAK